MNMQLMQKSLYKVKKIQTGIFPHLLPIKCCSNKARDDFLCNYTQANCFKYKHASLCMSYVDWFFFSENKIRLTKTFDSNYENEHHIVKWSKQRNQKWIEHHIIFGGERETTIITMTFLKYCTWTSSFTIYFTFKAFLKIIW